MLDIFRKQAGSWMIKAIFGIIIIVFVLWGGYSYKSRQETEVARVGDQYISVVDFNRSYNVLMEQYRRQLGGSVSDEILKQLNLKEEALNRLIEQVLITKAAQEYGFSATNEEIQQMILQIPAFQRDGQFDQRAYVLVLQQNHLTPELFERQIASDIAMQKVLEFIKRRAVVTEEDILADYRFANEKIQLEYAVIDPKAFESQVTADDKALQAYYQEHQENYKDPEKRQFAYVLFKTDDYLKDVTVSDADVRQYYDMNQSKYHHEPEVRARHILFSVKEDAPEAEVAKVRSEAEKVLQEARKGADFAELAKKYSMDPGSAKNGGDLGYFTKEQMVEPFSEAAFAMKPGEISGLVRTPYGFHIIKVEDVRPEKTDSFDDVKGSIEATLKKEKAQEMARRQARDLADVAFAQQDLEKAAQSEKLQATSVNSWTSKTDPIPGLGDSSLPVMNKLFALPEKGVSDTIEVSQGFLVAQVKAIQPPQVLGLEAVKARVEKDYKEVQAQKLAQQSAAEVLEAARKAGSLDDIAKDKKIEVKKTDWFSRREPDKNLKFRGESLNKVFQLQDSERFPSAPLTEVNNKFVVCQFLGRQTSDEGLEKEKDSIASRILMQKQAALWKSWMDEQRSKADIKMYRQL